MASEAVTANASAHASVPAQATVPVAMPAPASAGASLFAAAPAPVPAASDIPVLPETKPVSTPSEKPQEDPVKQRLYLQATKAIEEAGSSVYKWQEALNLISAPALQGYRDVAALRARTSARYNELSREGSKKGKRKGILAVLLAVVLAVGITVFLNSDPADKTSVEAKATATNGVGTQNNKKQIKVKTGDIVTLGHYEQDNDVTNGKEPIEWQVLDVQGNKALLISKYGLDAQPYNTEQMDVTWETCTLRSWLNSTFLNAAFTAEEQKGILTTAVDNSEAQEYSGYSTNGGNNTKDQIFLLSYAEVNKYFGVQYDYAPVQYDYALEEGAGQNTASSVAPTAYAIAQGAYAYTWSGDKTSEGKAAGYWWLRSPGSEQNDAAFVRPDGALSRNHVDDSHRAVRPAFWLDLDIAWIAFEKDYQSAKALQEAGKYEEAIAAYKKLNGYGDSAARIIACENNIKEKDYQTAKALLEAGKYAEAYTVYAGLKGYKDVDNILTSDENLIAAASAARKASFKTVGNVVTFGNYEQDNNQNIGKEPIEWIVLDVQGNKALLISKYGLDAQPYNTEYKSITWEKCTLRNWLNSTFLNAAFTAEEQKGILTTAVDNSKSQGYWSTDGDNNTQDKIFLLSYAEANKYFGVQYRSVYGADQNTASRVALTAYAIAQGAYTNSSRKTSEGKAAGVWWLRSPGSSSSSAAIVSYDGAHDRARVDGRHDAVRPAFWLDLESGIF